jgi:ketosteroid isomerase-like protein
MQITRRSLALAGVGLLCAAGLGPAALPAAAQASDAAAVARAVDALNQAMIAADRSALASLTADALSYGHSGGVVETKAEFIDVIANKKTVYKSINISDQSITVTENEAIVRHVFNPTVESGGQVSSPRVGIMQVWRKQGDRWQLLARQAYRLA